MSTHSDSEDNPHKQISSLAERIKENGDLLRNAIGQSWADIALDEIRTDAVEIQKLITHITAEQNK